MSIFRYGARLSRIATKIFALIASLRIAPSVRVSFMDARLTLASVHVRNGLLARLLGAPAVSHEIAAAVPSVDGGRLWIYDQTARRIRCPHCIDAIERERTRVSAEQRLFTTLRRA